MLLHARSKLKHQLRSTRDSCEPQLSALAGQPQNFPLLRAVCSPAVVKCYIMAYIYKCIDSLGRVIRELMGSEP